MIKYYEQTKSAYSKDTDHLVSINKNGVWINDKLEFSEPFNSVNNSRNEGRKQFDCKGQSRNIIKGTDY